MNTITTDVLHDLGITKTEAEEASIIAEFETTLQERVGTTIMDLLDEEQLTQFTELTGQNDQAAVTAWLQTNVPEYQQLVEDEYDILLGELAEKAETL